MHAQLRGWLGLLGNLLRRSELSARHHERRLRRRYRFMHVMHRIHYVPKQSVLGRVHRRRRVRDRWLLSGIRLLRGDNLGCLRHELHELRVRHLLRLDYRVRVR
jgi:hypothetical protein